ncbi:transcriptional regulator [Streptomyces lucensis JCM 4490]|uniref:Transcriptional regulator n=1 Tax=Streptomyces lucensis JCM 4490 TaxID=1306176 RepID=A0A918J3T7_9ACTN|nr:helix-turn-helix domain-containing protein [Streptomyces lucensis]GGW46597.1 transcriptional regulator [Streptomyces lucensis JCM 4490]
MPTQESPRRRELLDVLRSARVPLGVAEAAERMRLHPNTARLHLDALVSEGLAERRAEASPGPGRPRAVYTPRRAMDRGGVRDYLSLARVLLGRWASADPARAREEAMETGREWGRLLAAPPAPSGQPSAGRSVAALVALLDGLGFAPRAEGGDGAGRAPERIRLRHCPFLELAEEHGRLVCPLHLGLMRGALERLDAPLTATGLEPFAEPDSCVAHLAGTAAHREKEDHPR